MYVQLESQIIYYDKVGEGRPMVLLHGNGEDPADKLVYRNDLYMAVFSRIDDKGSAGGPAFTTSYVMLLRKP